MAWALYCGRSSRAVTGVAFALSVYSLQDEQGRVTGRFMGHMRGGRRVRKIHTSERQKERHEQTELEKERTRSHLFPNR
jgi:hypothetical protein